MPHLEWEILLIALVSEILGTASGLGSSILFLPLAQYFESPHLVMVLTAILHVFANGFRVYLFWAPRGFLLLKKLAPVFFISTGLGATLALWTTPPFYKLFLGIVLVVFGTLRFFLSDRKVKINEKKRFSLIAIAGLFTGWVGTGGAIRALALSTLSLSKYEFIFVSSGIDFGGDALRALIYLGGGFLGLDHVLYIPALALCAWAGSRIGKMLVQKISQSLFEKSVLLIIVTMGVSTIVHGLME